MLSFWLLRGSANGPGILLCLMQWEILNVVSDSVVCLNALVKNFNQINALALLMGLMVAWHFSVVGNFTARPAKLVRDCEMTAPCGTTILHPTSVVATFIVSKLYVTPRALFDVLSPPYCSEDGRHCSYYRMIPRTRRDLDVCCRQGVDEGEACGISPAQVACFDVWKRFNRQKAL
ncbi:hypothetical protein WN944_012397 [Citrus x changshan-huyou]|uniref:cysteine dioxygenase n=1 Tax=Citrus x changshan-huyou TaxID=2935761 RepID=A0AAP0QYZ3_9ROSI